MKTDTKVFFIPDFLIALKFIGEKVMNLSELCVVTDITYCHLLKLKDMFVHKGWVATKQEGRQVFMELTSKGSEIVITINRLLELLDIKKEDLLKYRRMTKKGTSKEVEKNDKV